MYFGSIQECVAAVAYMHACTAYTNKTRRQCDRKDDRAMRPMSASHVYSQSWTGVKLNRVFFVRLLVSPKFSHVSLGVGGLPFWGYEPTKSEGVGLIVRAISFQAFQPM